MPTNKRESLIFTFIMCFCMVLWMSIYNVARMYGHIGMDVIAERANDRKLAPGRFPRASCSSGGRMWR